MDVWGEHHLRISKTNYPSSFSFYFKAKNEALKTEVFTLKNTHIVGEHHQILCAIRD